MPQCRKFTRKSMCYGIIACEVAYFPFQANANYGTWSKEFGAEELILEMLKKGMKKDKWDQVPHSFSPSSSPF